VVLDDSDEAEGAGRHASHAHASDAEGADAATSAAPTPPARTVLHGTAADVRLIRQRSDVRNRCIAAVLVPFLIYVAALFATDRTNVFVIWIFAPTIAAGVLVGMILDHAHKRYPPE